MTVPSESADRPAARVGTVYPSIAQRMRKSGTQRLSFVIRLTYHGKSQTFRPLFTARTMRPAATSAVITPGIAKA